MPREAVNFRGPNELFEEFAMDIVRERIMDRVKINANGCWIFQGAITSRGYGSISVDGVVHSTHSRMYLAAGRIIPDGFEIDHVCHSESDCRGGVGCPHRPCCNPEHLEAVPKSVNWERGESPSRVNSLRTECKHGHPLTGDNLRIAIRKGRNPSRQCKTCHRNLILARRTQGLAA